MRSAAKKIRLGFGHELPLLLDDQPAEAGLACLAMVAGFYGALPGAALCRSHAASGGLNLTQLIRFSVALDLQARPLRLACDQLWQLPLPAVLQWQGGHYVVLRRCSGAQLLLHDPENGARTVSLDEAARCFTGVALELVPGPGFRRRSPYAALPFPATLRRLLHGWRRVRLSLAGVLGLQQHDGLS